MQESRTPSKRDDARRGMMCGKATRADARRIGAEPCCLQLGQLLCCKCLHERIFGAPRVEVFVEGSAPCSSSRYAAASPGTSRLGLIMKDGEWQVAGVDLDRGEIAFGGGGRRAAVALDMLHSMRSPCLIVMAISCERGDRSVRAPRRGEIAIQRNRIRESGSTAAARRGASPAGVRAPGTAASIERRGVSPRACASGAPTAKRACEECDVGPEMSAEQ